MPADTAQQHRPRDPQSQLRACSPLISAHDHHVPSRRPARANAGAADARPHYVSLTHHGASACHGFEDQEGRSALKILVCGYVRPR